MFNNKTYDMLKFVALIVLPALAVLYLGLGQLWEWPATDKVVGTITILDTFLGALLQISTAKYNNNPDGYLDANGANPDTGIPNLTLTVTKPPEELLSGKTARLKIGPAPQA